MRHWKPLLLLLTVVLGAVCLWNSHLLSIAPFAAEYVFDGPSGVFRGSSGNTYVVDVARKEVLILDENMEYVRALEGDSFYYATAVTDGPDGIYVADVLYAGTGTVVQAERLWRFEADGSGGEIVWQRDYPDPDTAPRQYGRIKSMVATQDGALLFAAAEGNAVRVYRYDPATGAVTDTVYDFGDSYVITCAPDPATGRPAIIAGDTALRTVDAAGTVQLLTRTDAFPYQTTVTTDGTVWFSELDSGTLMRVGEDGGMEMVSDEVYAYYVSSCGETVCISDGTGVAIWQDGQMRYMTQVPVANAGVRDLMWCLLFLCAAMLLVLLAVAARAIIRSWLAYPFFRKIAVVILVAVVASSAASWYLLRTTFREENALVMEQLDAISDQIVDQTDVDLVAQIHVPADYKGEAYNQLKEKLDAVINAGYARGEYFYYLTYILGEDAIDILMDYEDTTRTWMTFGPYGEQPYTQVFETAQPVIVKGEVSTWGAWTFVLKPVLDGQGNVVAVQEVGFNYDNQRLAQQETVINTILTIVFGAIVLAMLIIEGIYYTEHRSRKKALLRQGGGGYDQADVIPLRTLIFMAFTVDCMQDAFISILATRLYEPIWGIPQSVGAALPISGQVLMAAVFAVVGGFLASRFGARRVICTGFLIQASGFLLCGITLSYVGILLGKLLVGAGIGMISVGVNTVAAASSDESKSVETFAGITAGTLVGVSAGSGLGSTILSLFGYRTVFFVGTLILLGGFFTALTSMAGISVGRQARESHGAEAEQSSIGLGQFLFGRGGTIPFLAMVLMPFMVAIYSREYFFPIYAAENGMTETNIGRIYVLCGLMVIYAGPSMTKYLTEKLGIVRMMVLTSIIIAMASLSFAVLPNMTGAILGVVLVSVAISSGYTAQSSYYASRQAVSRFGEGRAMGVYSMFDNGGQTLGPIVYGSAMLLGYQTGMLLVGSALALLTACFAVVKRRELGKRDEQIQQEESKC